MIIKEEEINKLKQLDRIEYKQERDRIEKDHPFVLEYLSNACVVVFVAIFFSIILVLNIYSALEINMFQTLKPISFVCGLFVVCSVWLDFIAIIKNNKRIDNLQQKFFKLQTK